VTGVEHPAPRANGTADRFRRVGGRAVLLVGRLAVWGPVSPLIGSGVPAAGPSIIPLRIGEARPVAGVIHSRFVLSPSGSGFNPPNEISYRGVKLPKDAEAPAMKRNRKFVDSLLEEGVSSEPVSEMGFLGA
jgi:hypothetical protein